MNDQQKKEYLEHPNTCPYCESEDISGGVMQVDGTGAWQTIECRGCFKKWTDIYKLVDVEEDDD